MTRLPDCPSFMAWSLRDAGDRPAARWVGCLAAGCAGGGAAAVTARQLFAAVAVRDLVTVVPLTRVWGWTRLDAVLADPALSPRAIREHIR